ncbi:MAG: M48 family metallopeptidase [Ferrovibrio sp.]
MSASPDLQTSPAISGHLYDGRTAAAHEVVVGIGDKFLRFIAQDGNELAAWPLIDLRLLDQGTQKLRLQRDGDLARLIVPVSLLPELEAACPHLRRRGKDEWVILRRATAWAAAAAAGLTLTFLVLIPWAAEVVARSMSAEAELRFGDRIFQSWQEWEGLQEKKAAFLCDGQEGLAALRMVVDKLEAAVPARLPIRISVVNLPLVNAFALPGGRVVLTRGLLGFVNNEAELIGVVAHEMGHVDARHNMSGLVKQSATGFLVGLFFGDAVAGMTGLGLAQTLISSAYTREMEAEADQKAIERLRLAHIDPAQAAGFFARLARDERRGAALLSTHPLSQKRAAIFAAAQTEGRRLLDRGQWLDIRMTCR